jgi:hypothetical protein
VLLVIPPVADAIDLIADAREAAAVRLAGQILYELLKAVVGQLVFDEGIIVFFVWSQNKLIKNQTMWIFLRSVRRYETTKLMRIKITSK